MNSLDFVGVQILDFSEAKTLIMRAGWCGTVWEGSLEGFCIISDAINKLDIITVYF